MRAIEGALCTGTRGAGGGVRGQAGWGVERERMGSRNSVVSFEAPSWRTRRRKPCDLSRVCDSTVSGRRSVRVDSYTYTRHTATIARLPVTDPPPAPLGKPSHATNKKRERKT